VSNNIYTNNCIDCNEILSYSLTEVETKSRCFTCMCTFGELVTLLHAESLPDIYDVYIASHEGSQDAQKIRSRCIKLIEGLKNET